MGYLNEIVCVNYEYVLIFQFPLWDTATKLKSNNFKIYIFQFPLWDTFY